MKRRKRVAIRGGVWWLFVDWLIGRLALGLREGGLQGVWCGFSEKKRGADEMGGIASVVLWVKFQCHVVITYFRHEFFDNRFL